MGREFETRKETDVDATPEQVWQAIATGPGIDSWYMGRNDVEPGEGGTVRTVCGDYAPESAVTAWDLLKRFAYRSGAGEDGRFIAFEFLIEGRDKGCTVLRMVTSGFLPGDDWQAEYDAMTTGLQMYFRTLVAYLTYFPGRTAAPITALGPPVAGWEHARAVLYSALGLTGTVTEGERVRLTPDRLRPLEGVVDYATPGCLGVRTGDALYRFIQGFHGGVVIGHHIFSGADQKQAGQAWQAWLTRLFA